MIEVREYIDEQGASPFGKWFERLNTQAAAKVSVASLRLAQGNFSNVKGAKDYWRDYKQRKRRRWH